MPPSEKSTASGPFRPTLILHGGAGTLSRANLPPEFYTRYRASLLKYLTATKKLLDAGASALDSACHAVTMFEDDALFNCGRGSVFTEKGTIEMEASVMVASINPTAPSAGHRKRGAAVSLVRNTRHPILLAKEILLTPDEDGGLGGTSTMHCHLSGRDVEEWGWSERALEKKPDQWFWTKKRWEEHRRGLLRLSDSYTFNDLLVSVDQLSTSQVQDDDDSPDGVKEIPSQGTVGAVCLDSWGNLAVATSTGGLTNKKAGRIGDTPTIGSGFWAESWDTDIFDDRSFGAPAQIQPASPGAFRSMPILDQLWKQTSNILGSCLDQSESEHHYEPLSARPPPYTTTGDAMYYSYPSPDLVHPQPVSTRGRTHYRRRAVAMSGTGNGDSFLRTVACRTAGAIHFSKNSGFQPLSSAVSAIAGPDGLLQRSAEDRWGKTGEGQGGIIGIEVIEEPVSQFVVHGDKKGGGPVSMRRRAEVTFDFNCGGLFRAYYEVDDKSGEERPKMMVFREEY